MPCRQHMEGVIITAPKKVVKSPEEEFMVFALQNHDQRGAPQVVQIVVPTTTIVAGESLIEGAAVSVDGTGSLYDTKDPDRVKIMEAAIDNLIKSVPAAAPQADTLRNELKALGTSRQLRIVADYVAQCPSPAAIAAAAAPAKAPAPQDIDPFAKQQAA